MEEKILLAELRGNCKEKKAKVLELLGAFDLAELGHEVWEQRFKDIENKVLSEHKFFASKNCERGGINIKVGDRITDESFSFLLSDDDFERLQDLKLPIYVAENLTDERGYFIENWDDIVYDARNELVKYIIEEIVPSAFRPIFRENQKSLIIQEKLIKITKDAFCKKVA